jgi:RNA polymerase sigma-70 factor (ECF subfamily)
MEARELVPYPTSRSSRTLSRVSDAPTAIPSSLSAEELVDRYHRRVYALALDLTGDHHDAEDLSQEVLIKACESLDSYRGDAAPFTWLYRIAVNTYLNRGRGQKRQATTLQGDFEHMTDGVGAAPETGEHAERRQMQAHIEAALDVLSPRERSAFVLKHEHDLRIKDVAASMDVAPGTVKSLLYRATRKLRDELAFYRDQL